LNYGLKMPFDFDDYRAECEIMSDWMLQKELEKYTRMSMSGSASAGIGLGLALFTFGLSTIATAIGAAQMANAIKKIAILEEEAARRKQPLHLRKRDFVLGYGVGATAGVVSHGIAGHLVGSVAHYGAQHAHHIISPVGEHVLRHVDHGADKIAMTGSSQLEKSAYGEVWDTRKQYGDGISACYGTSVQGHC
jgi:hypothetical protein